MKKVLMAIALMAVAVSSRAQYDPNDEEDVVATASADTEDATPRLKYKYITNGFLDNWYVQLGGNYSVWYNNEEVGLGLDASPLKSYRSSPGVSIAIGKWFSPSFGLRTKATGIWGRRVGMDMWQRKAFDGGKVDKALGQYNDLSPIPAPDGYTGGNFYDFVNGMSKEDREKYFEKQSFNRYINIHEQALININNLFWGYNEKRIWNVSFFGGVGASHSFSNNSAWGMSISAGFHNSFKINSKLGAYFELGYYWSEHDSDQPEDNFDVDNDFFWNHDNQIYAEVGLQLNLGKSNWEKAPDMDAINALHQSQIDALNAQLEDANAENARLKELLREAQNRPCGEVKTIKETSTLPASVFFNLGKYEIASKKDLVNVQELANYAKDNNATLIVTGYADSATGSPEFNQTLSENRAKTVADELVAMGVSRDNLVVSGAGGVDTLTPISYNRRVTVKVGEAETEIAPVEQAPAEMPAE